ncbi:ChrR family anti-sigma-E factor [Gilvimarinus sp. DA14]|uniref:ChrR family anti-sigma-E factor n=1 Tax=Gilvimarinus sp. DA14 TaxID=2956798 RepID=UPI0020B72C07|nr:ChrR family anti-sigma-E factor [Gilvimarinus sp. DA14]UTF59380.1 ChrR family anti-sigma-E factor [Gilvimarinus sp. DA14]
MSGYHPDEITLMDYSAGTLAMPQALAVSVHLFMCTHCRNQVKQFNNLGGELLTLSEPRELEVQGFDDFMQAMDDEPVKPEPEIHSRYENPLAALLPQPLDRITWRKQTRDIAEYDLTDKLQVQGFRIALQKIRAGARVPQHSHKGQEFTVILQGGFSDELGVYHEGDFISRDPSHRHTPTALQNEDCICLTVLDAPIYFVGRFYRLLNPFLRW